MGNLNANSLPRRSPNHKLARSGLERSAGTAAANARRADPGKRRQLLPASRCQLTFLYTRPKQVEMPGDAARRLQFPCEWMNMVIAEAEQRLPGSGGSPAVVRLVCWKRRGWGRSLDADHP
jgi:hypothetical protein